MNRVILCVLGHGKSASFFLNFWGFILFFLLATWNTCCQLILAAISSLSGKKKPKPKTPFYWCSPSVSGSFLEPLIFLCWQNAAVFCPDSSALGSLCKRSFQSSSFLPSALPEISTGGERCSVDVALLDSSAELSEVLLNLQISFSCKWHKLIKKKPLTGHLQSVTVFLLFHTCHILLSLDKCWCNFFIL